MRSSLVACTATTLIAVVSPALAQNLSTSANSSITGPVDAGTRVGVSSTITNTALFFATPACRSGVWLSSYPVPTNGDVLLTSWTTPALSAGGYQQITKYGTLPVGLAGGRYWVYTYADDLDTVQETTNADNWALTNTLGFIVNPVVDLVITNVQVNGTLRAGTEANLSITVKNQGGADSSGLSMTGVFLSKNASIVTTDTLLGTLNTPALAAGASFTHTMRATIPYCDGFYASSGQTYLGAIANLFGGVSEANTGNNTYSRSVTCAAGSSNTQILEWRATATGEQPQSASSLRVKLGYGINADICANAPLYPNYKYLLLWSASPSFAFDAFTSFSLQLLNTPAFPAWFGTLDASGRAMTTFQLPPLPGLQATNLLVYTHHAYWTPTLQFAGYASAPVQILFND